MNIAFPAIIFLLLILPGFLARSAFWRSEKQNLDFSPLSTAMVSVVILSGFLHAIWIFLVEKFTAFTLSYGDILTLLAAQAGDPFKTAIEQAVKYPRATSAYFVTIYCFASCTGFLLRKGIRKYRLDRKGGIGPLLKFDTPWYYLFKDLESGVSGTWVNAVVEIGSKTFLYSGIVDDFHVDKEGGLDRIILMEASQQETSEPGDAQEPDARNIPGKLVLRYSEIKTMTVDKFSSDEG